MKTFCCKILDDQRMEKLHQSTVKPLLIKFTEQKQITFQQCLSPFTTPAKDKLVHFKIFCIELCFEPRPIKKFNSCNNLWSSHLKTKGPWFVRFSLVLFSFVRSLKRYPKYLLCAYSFIGTAGILQVPVQMQLVSLEFLGIKTL